MSFLSSINLMNLYKRWTYSENNSVWSDNAKYALWKRDPTSDLPRLDLPRIGAEHFIKFDGSDIRLGDTLKIEYSPASVYFNGVETATDLESIRMFTGVIKSFVPSKRTNNVPIEFVSEATFEIQSASSLSDFAKRPAISADNLTLWSYFQEGYFYNLTNLNEYILLSWASDSYAGAHCFIQRKNESFYVLRCHEWLYGSFDEIHYGRVTVPQLLAERLNNRLLTLEEGNHWAGDLI